MENYWHENQTDHIIKPYDVYDNRAGGTHNKVLRNVLD
jgi:hypothetical protein